MGNWQWAYVENGTFVRDVNLWQPIPDGQGNFWRVRATVAQRADRVNDTQQRRDARAFLASRGVYVVEWVDVPTPDDHVPVPSVAVVEGEKKVVKSVTFRPMTAEELADQADLADRKTERQWLRDNIGGIQNIIDNSNNGQMVLLAKFCKGLYRALKADT